ncbi:flagellar biosynthesis protein FlgL [Helicobacter sp. 13S00401-1]|uniref:flagellar hook-associated protein FlgL n=1 Tax=Helicobacter sp. 13S00401-1 TaxID=1905758 RepID=UPI000BA536EF|nr:flagellar hook-associated protein FlgL [Helicobacter sp. 13S00401-1]PAF50914.1 flagellar biosynthesis protein FlgL [Helicobacter sp. 13S00401-1]
MRVTFGTKYNQMANNQSALAEKLNDTNAKIASGMKIQQPYQDSSIFNQNLKLQYDETTLGQNIDVAKSAHTATLNTDQALSDISKSMDDFKTKLLYAANEVHTPTSRQALANDLKSIRNHIINVANTSIGGEFIFGGSRVDERPFDDDGTYRGNNQELKALLGSKNEVPFNITGKDLFLSADNDKSRKITTNMPLYNQRLLHPGTMDADNQTAEPKEVFIKESDTLRDLIGDNDTNTTNNDKEYFYIRGVRSDGSAFKEKFGLDLDYNNQHSATKVKDLLERIGKAFGNTNLSKAVEVKLNAWGEIEIKDLQHGSSSLDFHMISSDKNVDNIDQLEKLGAHIKVYNMQNITPTHTLSTVSGVDNKYDNRLVSLPNVFINKDNSMPGRLTKLEDVVSSDTRYIKITGTSPNTDDGKINNAPLGGEKRKPLIVDVKGATLGDLTDEIQRYFGGKVEVEIDEGVINIFDKNVKSTLKDSVDGPFDGEHGLSINMESLDKNMKSVNGFSPPLGASYVEGGFRLNGSSLDANIAQNIAGTSKLATEDSKLIDVTTGSLNNKTYNMLLHDHNGVKVEASLHFSDQGTFLELPPKDGEDARDRGAPLLIPIFNPKDAPPAVTITKANDITYRQLMDAMSIALNYSNLSAKDLQNAEIIKAPTQENKLAYENLLKDSARNIDVSLDTDGKMHIKDLTRSTTRMRFNISDSDENDFSEKATKANSAMLRLNANSALTIDDPKINFFKGLDEAIEAVSKGIYRPGSLNKSNYSDDLENRGIQNSISLIDHLSDHIEKIIAKNGAHSRSFESAIQRQEMVKTQVSAIKGETIGADIAKTYNEFNNLTNNYNAVLASTSKINQLSLVDYLR